MRRSRRVCLFKAGVVVGSSSVCVRTTAGKQATHARIYSCGKGTVMNPVLGFPIPRRFQRHHRLSPKRHRQGALVVLWDCEWVGIGEICAQTDQSFDKPLFTVGGRRRASDQIAAATARPFPISRHRACLPFTIPVVYKSFVDKKTDRLP